MTPLEVLARSFREIQISKIGVYLLICGDEIVYVGTSADIGTRIHQHATNIGGKSPSFDRAMWIELPAADLLAYEAALVRAFAPRFNAYIAKDSSRDVEILKLLGLDIPAGDHSAWLAIRRERLAAKHLTPEPPQ